MAGSEKTGFEASSDRLIENAYYIITPGGEVATGKPDRFHRDDFFPGCYPDGSYK